MPKPFPAEFRRDVVATARQSDQSIAAIARSFGVSESCLSRGLRIADKQDGISPETKHGAEFPDRPTNLVSLPNDPPGEPHSTDIPPYGGHVSDDATAWPELSDDMVRVWFTGGRLGGAVLDLPTHLSDTAPGQLVVTASGVCDRDDNYRLIQAARVLRAPNSTRPVRTPAVCSDYV